MAAWRVFCCSVWGLVPWPEIEPEPLHWACGVLATGPPWEVSNTLLFNMCVMFHPCVFAPVNGHLGCFQFWNIIARAVVNPYIYLLVWDGFLVSNFSGVPDDVWAERKCRSVRQWAWGVGVGVGTVSIPTKRQSWILIGGERITPWKHIETASSSGVNFQFISFGQLASRPLLLATAAQPWGHRPARSAQDAAARGDVQWLFPMASDKFAQRFPLWVS